MRTRENLKLATVAVFCLLLAWTGPSIAHGVHAKFAHNADKVDGKHAVGAGAGLTKARGKLVAHNGSGKMPAKFIPTLSGGKLKNGSVARAKLAPRARIHWAHVLASGALVRHSGGITANRRQDGIYDVRFPIAVAGCAYSATTFHGLGVVGAQPRSDVPREVTVQANTGSGTNRINAQFYLIVTC